MLPHLRTAALQLAAGSQECRADGKNKPKSRNHDAHEGHISWPLSAAEWAGWPRLALRVAALDQELPVVALRPADARHDALLLLLPVAPLLIIVQAFVRLSCTWGVAYAARNETDQPRTSA